MSEDAGVTAAGPAETAAGPAEDASPAEPLIERDEAAPDGEADDGGPSDERDDDDDDDDEGPPPLNAAHAVPMTQGEAQGALACSVCLEPVAISGPHQVCALACGHCFGHSCIHTWLERKKRGNGGRCPQCNKKAVTKDIRKLFVPDFRAFVDTEELDEAREALAKERAGRIEAEANQLRISQRLKKTEERLKECERERDEAIERAKSGAGAGGTQNGTQGGGGRDGDAAAWGFLQPSVGGTAGGDRKRKKETDDARGEGTILRAFDPNREETLERERVEAEEARRRRAEEDERRHRESMRGRYSVRFVAPVRGARAFDANGQIVAVAEQMPGRAMDGEGVALTKISLGAPASQRVHVRLPRGSGAVRDVRLNGQSGRDICLVASLGKRLTVVDNVSDSVCASVGLPAPAWCCAWGGWGIGNTENHFGVDPSEDPNLVSVGLANGCVLMYDLRRTDAHVASVGVESGATPVHSVIPLPKTVGGGVMFGNMSGAHHHPGGFGGSGDGTDSPRWATPLAPGLLRMEGPCTSLCWAPGSFTVVAAQRGVHDMPARHSLARRLGDGDSGIDGGGDFGDFGAARRWSLGAVAQGHVNQSVLSRVALLRPRVKGAPTFLAGACEATNCVAVWRCGDGAMTQRLPPHRGGDLPVNNQIFDVRSWSNSRNGGGEVLASLSKSSLQLCAWQQEQ